MSLLSNTAIKKILSETQTWSASQNYQDNAKLLFGESGGDLDIYHDGSNSYIQDDGTGSLNILGSEINLKQENGGSGVTYFQIAPASTRNIFYKPARFGTNVQAYFGDSDNGYVNYNGSYLKLESPEIWIDANGGALIMDATGNIVMRDADDSNAELFVLNTGTRALTIGSATDDVYISQYGYHRIVKDGTTANNYFSVGAGDDLKIYHTGTISYLYNTGGTIEIQSTTGSDMVFSQTLNDTAKSYLFKNTNDGYNKSSQIGIVANQFADSGSNYDARMNIGVATGSTYTYGYLQAPIDENTGSTETMRFYNTVTMFLKDSRHQDDFKHYWGSNNDAFAYYNSSTLDFEIQHSGDLFYITHAGGVGSNRQIAFNLRNQIVFQDRGDSNAELFSFDMNARTMTVGKDNDGVDVSFYGDTAGEWTTLWRNYNYDAGSRTTLKLMVADQSTYISSHRDNAGYGATMEFYVTLDSDGSKYFIGDLTEDKNVRFFPEKFMLKDDDDSDETLFEFDTTARTLTIGATDGNDDIATSFYGDVFLDNETLYFGTATDEDGRIKIDQTTTDEIKFVLSDAGGSSLGFALNSGTYPQIYSPSDSYILFGDHIIFLDGKGTYFGSSFDSIIKWHGSNGELQYRSDGHHRFTVDDDDDGTGWFYVDNGADETMFAISETEASFPTGNGIRLAYNVSSNYDFTTAVTDDGITISTASNTRDMIFKLGSSATQILRLADTLFTVGSTDNQIPLAISRYENSGTYDDFGVIRPNFVTGGIAIDSHDGSGYVKTLEITKSQQVRLAQDSDDEAGNGAYFSIGAGHDLKMWHSGTNSYLHNDTGSMYIENNTTGDMIFKTGSGTPSEFMRLDTSASRITTNATFTSNTAHAGTLDTFSGDISTKAHTQTATLHATADFLGGAYSSLSLIEKLALKSIMYRINIANHTVNYLNIDAGGGTSTYDITIQYQYTLDGGSSYTDIGTHTERISDSGGSFTTAFSNTNAYPRGNDITGDVSARIRVTMVEVGSKTPPSTVTAYTGAETVTSTLTTRTSFN